MSDDIEAVRAELVAAGANMACLLQIARVYVEDSAGRDAVAAILAGRFVEADRRLQLANLEGRMVVPTARPRV